ncbi:nitroreductase family protein [Algibacter lectus]|uniref:Nitroreductase n=1 Tax=Algibacter lectus TaxID=221126 RepID=A0A4R8MDN8_9FLAO|nr:nitroreductase family protein [Algibacter lectus]MWW24423.1 nitroreductase [Algibacter lectus]TDY62442.1 nitroreductase [Algibacter lectus]
MKKILGKLYFKVLLFKNNILPRYFIATPFFSKLYYFLFSSTFNREQHAVLKGKINHLKELERDKANIYTLIRNTHRIEKGLLMRPRRDVFALDYIEETIEAFLNIWDPKKIDIDLQYKWFYDVLSEYFSTSGDNELISKLATKFNNKVINVKTNEASFNGIEKSIPYHRLEEEKPNISYEDFFKLMRFRRSVRWFLDKKVPRTLIDKAILAAAQSPSACNRQPFEYRVIDDPELLKGVVNLPGGVRGYVDGIQTIIVVLGNLDAYFDERDRHVIYIDASLANMSFMLALETLGLSSCAINWPDVEVLEKKMEHILKLEKHQRPIMCMAVGYPDPLGKVAFSEKRTLEHIRTYNYGNSN